MNPSAPIIMAHNRYRHPGGEDVVFEADAALLRDRGHPVIRYEISNHRIESMGRMRLFLRTIASLESYRCVSALIRRHRPAVLHCHNFFPLLSPSIIIAAARHGVPVVQHLHNYRLLCPNALFLRQGRICEDCLGRRLAWPAVRYGCYRHSRAATGAVAAMIVVHRMFQTWNRRVARWIAPSAFARRKFIDGGFDPERIAVRPNYLQADPGIGIGPRAGGVFVGMLQPWKGADVLLRAWRTMPETVELRLIGDGPEAASLARIAGHDPRIRFVGQQDATGVFDALRSARWLVFPSIVYETFGRTLAEAFACGTPVIASRLGTAAEIVTDGVTGLLFRPGNVTDLADRLRYAIEHPEAMERMGRAARVEYEHRYTAETAYTRLIEIYREAIAVAK